MPCSLFSGVSTIKQGGLLGGEDEYTGDSDPDSLVGVDCGVCYWPAWLLDYHRITINCSSRCSLLSERRAGSCSNINSANINYRLEEFRHWETETPTRHCGALARPELADINIRYLFNRARNSVVTMFYVWRYGDMEIWRYGDMEIIV